MLSFICRKAPTGFDDKAELQAFDRSAQKQSFACACLNMKTFAPPDANSQRPSSLADDELPRNYDDPAGRE
jgi:hypothetical protein